MRNVLTRLFFAASIVCITCISAEAAERAETDRLIQRISPPVKVIESLLEKKDSLIGDSYFEQSDIFQGNRTGHWSELTNTYGYTHGKVFSYLTFSELERFDNRDYTGATGSYINFDKSYCHYEVGFGWDVDYIYNLQVITEYAHEIYKGLYGQIGYSFRSYPTNDVHLVYPGLIYYFGDNYISGDFGVNYIENRDTGYFGTFKGNVVITQFLRWWGGVSFGQRLYDIYELDADQESGYTLFTGVTWTIYKGISMRAGYSYGTEKPKFIKRSVNLALTAKF